MKDFLRRFYKEVILIFFYIAIAVAAYVCWFDSLWHLWYVDLVTAISIVVVGATVGFLYIKSIEKEESQKKEKEEKNSTEEKIEASELEEFKEKDEV